MVWEFGSNKIPTYRTKNTAFSQKWVYKDKFGLRAMHAPKVFLRNRKNDLRGPKDYEKKFVQVLPKLVTRSQKHIF